VCRATTVCFRLEGPSPNEVLEAAGLQRSGKAFIIEAAAANGCVAKDAFEDEESPLLTAPARQSDHFSAVGAHTMRPTRRVRPRY